MITQNEILLFLQACLQPFAPYIVFAFTLMIVFAIAMGVRTLLIWGR